jgi:hypothetical protein
MCSKRSRIPSDNTEWFDILRKNGTGSYHSPIPNYTAFGKYYDPRSYPNVVPNVKRILRIRMDRILVDHSTSVVIEKRVR